MTLSCLISLIPFSGFFRNRAGKVGHSGLSAGEPEVVDWVPIPKKFLAVGLDDLVKDVSKHCL